MFVVRFQFQHGLVSNIMYNLDEKDDDHTQTTKTSNIDERDAQAPATTNVKRDPVASLVTLAAVYDSGSEDSSSGGGCNDHKQGDVNTNIEEMEAKEKKVRRRRRQEQKGFGMNNQRRLQEDRRQNVGGGGEHFENDDYCCRFGQDVRKKEDDLQKVCGRGRKEAHRGRVLGR